MADSELNMTLRTVREGANVTDDALNELKDFDKGLTNVEKVVAGTRTTIGKLDESLSVMGKSVGSATELMHGLGINIPISPMELFGTAIQKASQYTSEAVDEYSKYVDQISVMAAYTNTTTEEMSKLFQIADDLRIPVESLEMALKSMSQNGVEASINGLANLADRYNALQDPVARAQFLYENFGRAGQDMARIMEEGSQAIRDNADALQDWMIVTGDTEEQVLSYLAAQDRWEESQMRIQYQWANNVIPGLSKLMGAIMDTDEEIRNSETSWMRYAGVLGAVQTVIVGLKNLFSQDKNLPTPPETTVEEEVKLYANVNRGNLADRQNVNIYGGGRAGGGPVFPGFEYDVGEREKETFVPTTPGFIVPNSNGGSGPTIIIQYSSAVSLANMEEAEQVLVPMIRQALRSV